MTNAETERRDRVEAIYHFLLNALDGAGDYPRFRAEVIEECGKAFERFLEKYCVPPDTATLSNASLAERRKTEDA